MRLTRKLIGALIVGVTLVLSVHGYLRFRREANLFQQDMARDHAAIGRALGPAVSLVARQSGTDRAIGILDHANLHEDEVEIRWVALDGNGPVEARPRVPFDQLRETMHGQIVSRIVGKRDRRFLVTYVPVDLQGGRPTAIELAESLADERAYLDTTILRTATTTLVTIVVCAGLIALFGWYFVGRSMHTLADKARRVGQGDLTGPLKLRQRDEVGDLAEEMNRMCERLEAAQTRIREETSARLATVEQLRHANRLTTVGKLASGLAHELGTPLNVVSARAKMIERGESVDQEACDDARIIAEQADRMTRIIRQLLDFARRRSPRKADQDLGALVDRTIQLLEPLATKRSVELRRTTRGPVAANVDAAQIEQVLTNLLVNAIHAQPDGGSVRVAIEPEHALPPPDPGGPEGDFLRITIEDDGEGIPADVIDHVFEPFFTTKDVGAGTGLGLSVAFGIVREHGGWISVESTPGAGTRFAVHLPPEGRGTA